MRRFYPKKEIISIQPIDLFFEVVFIENVFVMAPTQLLILAIAVIHILNKKVTRKFVEVI